MDVDQMMITLLNMSITAGFAALLVMALRLLYKRLPKRFSLFMPVFTPVGLQPAAILFESPGGADHL